MTPEKKVRRRLPRSEREQLIVAEAVRFFAEVGLEGQTRALAERLGVTQPLLYRYFPDKEALIERVYQEAFIEGWDPEWTSLLADRSRPLRDRLVDFYLGYTHAHFSYERVRLFMFAGLKDQGLVSRYLAFIHENLFIPLARELRAEAGLSPAGDITDSEIECVAGLHGAIGYVGTRRWIFKATVPEDADAAVINQIDTFFKGASATFRALERHAAE
ncbi:MAG: TetR/AcrR family transcriptional regulator [Solirubrobacterales bacterium]